MCTGCQTDFLQHYKFSKYTFQESKFGIFMVRPYDTWWHLSGFKINVQALKPSFLSLLSPFVKGQEPFKLQHAFSSYDIWT